MQLYNDDCFNIFPKIKEKVDMVCVDLPFSQTSCHWDIPIDLTQMWIELKKICKRDCVYVFFCTTKFGYKLIQSNEKWFRYDLVWEKSRKVGFLSANKMPLRKHEMVYIFKEKGGTYNPQKTTGHKSRDRSVNKKTKLNIVYGDIDISTGKDTDETRHPTSILHIPEAPENQEEREHEMVYIFKEKQGTYNPQKTEGKPYTTKGNKSVNPEEYLYDDRVKEFYAVENTGTRHPTTIVKFNNPSKSVHRTQKPVDLCEWLIKSYSNEEELVLDFTMGSGSTAIACKNTNRRFIGIEKDEKIFKIAQNRISE